MHQETELLVEAIKSLYSEPNYFKDYVFPIASAFFTSILGGAIAYLTLRSQENVQIEKEKMDATNKWTLNAEEARGTLFAIKGNYHGGLDDNPFQRLTAIPSTLFKAKPLAEDFHGLSFIVPAGEEAKEDLPKWSQIPRVRAMVSNYNYVLELWEQRNTLNEQFKARVLEEHGDKAKMMLSHDDIVQAVGQAFLVAFIDLNERVIRLTDDLILELDDFMSEFPKFAKRKIQLKRLKRYGSILVHSNNENPHILELLKKSPDPDYGVLSQIFSEPEEDIRARFSTGYEH